MTHAIADFSPPPLSRYAPQAIILAITAHVLVLMLVLMTPSPEGGGGGHVVGRLSVSLGAGGTAGQTLQTIVEETTMTPEPPTLVRPEPVRTRPPEPRKIEPARQQPTPRASRPPPVSPPTVQTPPPATPQVDRRQDVNVMPSDAAPGSMDAGTSSVGEGAPATTIGLGATDDVAGDAHDAYLAMVRSRIEANRRYPAAARRRQAEGTVDVYIEISETGELTFLEITSRSGSAHLDRAALRMAERAGPFPRPPVSLFTTTIPINFSFL
ncbi:MAG: TonB family protein [Rhodobacteraceae bacterium]|nr:TonB family protein [Paracoccaceae bacterium]